MNTSDENMFFHKPAGVVAAFCLALAAVVAIVAVNAQRAQGPASMIRLANETGIALKNVRVNGLAFGNIDVGGVTGYQAMTPAYRYAALRLEAGTTVADSSPDDYVGETPLGAGQFTYRLRRGQDGHFSAQLLSASSASSALP